jgi:hypothetical protein
VSERIGRRPFLGGLAFGLLWPGGLVARAGGDPLLELVEHSDCCVSARSLAAGSSYRVLGGIRRIVTLHRLRVDEALDGPVRTGDELTLRTLGGRVGDLAQRVFGEAEIVIGRPALLFLYRANDAEHVVTDLAGGHFDLDRDAHGVARVRVASGQHAQSTRVKGAAAQLAGASTAEVRQMLTAMRGQLAR